MKLLQTFGPTAAAAEAAIRQIEDRGDTSTASVAPAVAEILAAIHTRGDAALLEYATRFDGFTGEIPPAQSHPLRVSRDEMETAWLATPEDLRAAMRLAQTNIRAFAERQLPRSWSFQQEDGVETGQVVRALASVGCYVPGGRYPLPSTLLMTVTPAQVAGVERIVVCSPRPAQETLAAAYLANVTEFYRVGGAQAIAALAFGTPRPSPASTRSSAPATSTSPPPRSPSAANPSMRHRHARRPHRNRRHQRAPAPPPASPPTSSPRPSTTPKPSPSSSPATSISRTPSSPKSNAGREQRPSPSNPSPPRAIFVTESVTEAQQLTNRLAPEHLSVDDGAEDLAWIQNAGSVFVGPHSPQSMGDYISGPNHVLPTGRNGRIRGGLSVLDFVKIITVQRYTRDGLANIGPHAIASPKPKASRPRQQRPRQTRPTDPHERSGPNTYNVERTTSNRAPHAHRNHPRHPARRPHPRPPRRPCRRLPAAPPPRPRHARVPPAPRRPHHAPPRLQREHLRPLPPRHRAHPAPSPPKTSPSTPSASTSKSPPPSTSASSPTRSSSPTASTRPSTSSASPSSKKTDEALISTPTFFMYDVSVGMMTERPHAAFRPTPRSRFPLERFLAAITPQTKLILVASAQQPHRRHRQPRDHLLQPSPAAAPHAVLFVDEAYFHFHGETTLPDVGTIPNLIVGRTFSKAYGLANLRIGMLAGPARLIGRPQSRQPLQRQRRRPRRSPRSPRRPALSRLVHPASPRRPRAHRALLLHPQHSLLALPRQLRPLRSRPPPQAELRQPHARERRPPPRPLRRPRLRRPRPHHHRHRRPRHPRPRRPNRQTLRTKPLPPLINWTSLTRISSIQTQHVLDRNPST